MTAAERRDVNIANAEPVEEVVPQRPVGLRRDVAVGRGHKPHVAAHTSVTAHGEDFLCLDDPKKLRLVLVVELADFVEEERALIRQADLARHVADRAGEGSPRSEEHASELQSLMRISYAVFCLKKKTTRN